MTTGKEAFNSVAENGVTSKYNGKQLSQVFYGIQVAIQEIADSGGGNIVISGSQPDGTEEGQIAFFQGADGNYYEYVWVGGSWANVKTQNNDVTVADSAPFITISGTEIETQSDINHYLNDKIESLILDPSGEPIDLAPFATIEYSDTEDAKLQAQIDALTPEPDLGPPTTVQRLYRFSRTTLNNGEMFGNTDNAELMTSLTFADKDAANQDTPVLSEGDLIEFGGWKYKVTNSASGVEYVSGPGGTITIGTRYAVTFTIYPTGLANRVAAGEETQAQIIATISGALETQNNIEVRVASGETIQGELVTRVTEGEATHAQLATRVASGETTQQQIVGRLDMLETTRGADKIYQVHSVTTDLAVRNGELVFNNTDATLVSFISLAPFDSNGNSSPLVNEGDIIDVEVGGTTNRYQVAQGTTDAQSILCIYLSGDSTFAVNQTVTIYIYPQNASNLATTDYVDAQTALKLNRSGGLLTGNVTHAGTANQIMTNSSYIRFGWGDANTVEEWGGYIYQRNSTTFEIGAYSGIKLKFIGEPVFDKSPEVPTPTLDPHAASKYYVDNQIGGLQSSIGDYLPLTGGTLTGNLHLDNGSGLHTKEIIKSTRNTGYAFQVKPDDGTATAYIHTNGNAKFVDVEATNLTCNDTLDVSNIFSASSTSATYTGPTTSDNHITTKVYVDNKFAGAIGNGMRWKHANHVIAGDLVSGEFFIADNGNIYLHPISYDGVNLGVSSTATEVTGMKQLASVHRANGESSYHITWDEISYNNLSNKYIRIKKNATHLGDSTSNGEIYRLNIPGFTF